jgi:Capsular polysaccharide synthesis protein
MTQPVPLAKTIWILWLQGIANAPYVVRKCCESWVDRNSGWNVVLLDAELLARFRANGTLMPELDGLSPQQASDLVRLSLLAQFGGVWADATCFCVSPLDDWLPSKLDSGFFAFARPGWDRILSSWFIAAQQNNRLITDVYDFMYSYWSGRPIRRDHNDPIVRLLARLLRSSPQTRALWFSPLIRDRLGASPYFALHYGFEKVIRDNPECHRIWEYTPKISASGPHKLLASGLTSTATDEIRAEIDSGATPVYKTTWKIDSLVPTDSVLGYLLNT